MHLINKCGGHRRPCLHCRVDNGSEETRRDHCATACRDEFSSAYSTVSDWQQYKEQYSTVVVVVACGTTVYTA